MSATKKPTSATVILRNRNIWGDLRDESGKIFLCDSIFHYFPFENKDKVFKLKISRRPFKGAQKLQIVMKSEIVYIDKHNREGSMFFNLRMMIMGVFNFRGREKKNIYFSLTREGV